MPDSNAAPRILVVISPRGYQDVELDVPLAVWAGRMLAVVASTRVGLAEGKAGGRRRVEVTVAGAGARFDGVVVIGGTGAVAHLWDHEPLLALVRVMARDGGLLAAICFGSVVLARAGVLAGRNATVYPSARAEFELRRGGAVLSDTGVVRDGPVITARCPKSAAAFAAAVQSHFGL